MDILTAFFALFEGNGSEYLWYRLFIVMLGAGLVVSSVVLAVKRKVLGDFVRKLYAAGATSPEKAKKYAEIGVKHGRFLKRSLERGTLSRMLGCIEKDAHDEAVRASLESAEADGKSGKGSKIPLAYKPNVARDSFYLPQDRAESLLSVFSEKGSGVLSVILTVVFACGVVCLLWYAMPYILSMLDNAFGND